MNIDLIRLTFFIVLLFSFFILELIIPKRKLKFSRFNRWKTNFSLVLVDTFILKFCFPLLAYGVSLYAYENSQGLFNLFKYTDNATYFIVFLSLVVLDFTIYVQHVMFHKIPFLWRFHKLHHSDLDLDFSSGFRFHPVEIVISMFIKCSVVFIIGAPPISVLLFEIILNSCSLFNHANISIRNSVENFLRIFIVTPDMHRIHHSIKEDETDSNYSFCLSFWDKLFGTYKVYPHKGHKEMIIGLKNYRILSKQTIKWIFFMPFYGMFR